MAKQSHDREDLLRDAHVMTFRGRVFADGVEIFLGFRAAGQASLYWDQDPVFQFNSSGELRRLYLGGVRYASESRELVELGAPTSKPTSPPEADSRRLVLQRRRVDRSVQATIQATWELCRSSLGELLVGGEHDRWEVVGESDEDFIERSRAWLDGLAVPLQAAQSPGLS